MKRMADIWDKLKVGKRIAIYDSRSNILAMDGVVGKIDNVLHIF